MIDILALRSFNPIFRTSTPSIMILPLGSARRNKAATRLDFPAPVRPTIPTFSLGSVLNERLRSTSFSSGAYRNSMSENSTLPSWGHSATGCKKVGLSIAWESKLYLAVWLGGQVFWLQLAVLHHPLHAGHQVLHLR